MQLAYLTLATLEPTSWLQNELVHGTSGIHSQLQTLIKKEISKASTGREGRCRSISAHLKRFNTFCIALFHGFVWNYNELRGIRVLQSCTCSRSPHAKKAVLFCAKNPSFLCLEVVKYWISTFIRTELKSLTDSFLRTSIRIDSQGPKNNAPRELPI